MREKSLLPCYYPVMTKTKNKQGLKGNFLPSGSLFKITSAELALPIVEIDGAMEARPAIDCLHIQNEISFLPLYSFVIQIQHKENMMSTA